MAGGDGGMGGWWTK